MKEVLRNEPIIGILWYENDSEFVDCSDIEQYCEKHDWRVGNFTEQDYYDDRKICNLTRFDYCPFTGVKIDWAAMKKKLK